MGIALAILATLVFGALARAAVSRGKGKRPPAGRLSASDKNAANFLAGAVRRYGPLNRQQVTAYAAQQRARRTPGSSSTAYGLERVASDMKPGEVISGSVPWWKRF